MRDFDPRCGPSGPAPVLPPNLLRTSTTALFPLPPIISSWPDTQTRRALNIEAMSGGKLLFSTIEVTKQAFYRSSTALSFAIVNLKPIVPGREFSLFLVEESEPNEHSFFSFSSLRETLDFDHWMNCFCVDEHRP